MTDAVQSFTLNIPAGNGSTLEWGISATLGWSNVTQIILVFPPGLAGLVGARIGYAGGYVYPAQPGQYFVADDYDLVIPVTNQQQAGQWTVNGYNKDTYVHNVYGWFFYDYIIGTESVSNSGLVSL
jgi:hypothetical protein